MKYITIDPGLACTTLWVPAMDRSFSITTKNSDKRQRRLMILMKDLYKLINGIKEKTKISLAVIEQYAFAPAATQSLTMCAEAGGVIRMVLETFNINTVEIAISTWKSLAMGPKFVKIKKGPEYLEAVEKAYNRKFSTYDIADAFLMHQAVKKIIVGDKLSSAQLNLRRLIVGHIQVGSKVLPFADRKEVS